MTITAPTPDELVVTRAVVEDVFVRRRRMITGWVLVAIGMICIFVWGLGSDGGDAAFVLSESGEKVSIPTVRFSAIGASILLGLVICAIGGWHLVRGFPRRRVSLVLGIVAALFVVSFLCWADTGKPTNPIDVVGMLQTTIFLAVPLIIGAMAGVLCERSGVINVSIEGQMLVGCFAGAFGASVASNLGVGVIFAIVAGGLLGSLLAVFSIKYLVNQVVLGVVLNLLALGLTGYLYDSVMAPHPDKYNKGAVLASHQIPGLVHIPVIGKALFDANYIVYAMYVLVIVIDVALF